MSYPNFKERLFNTRCLAPKLRCTKLRVVRESPVVDESGHKRMISEFVNFDPTAEVQNYKISDFSLDNLIDLGASLDECPKLTENSLNVADNMSYQMSKMCDYVEKNETKVEQPF